SFTISPVGSNREVPLNIRIITATNRDLALMVHRREFREDLYFRVNTFQVQLADLASEPARIIRLADKFAAAAAAAQQRPYGGLSEAVREELIRYSWPGNVRELKNAMEFAVAMNSEPLIQPGSLP